jgi:hypothetical protein
VKNRKSFLDHPVLLGWQINGQVLEIKHVPTRAEFDIKHSLAGQKPVLSLTPSEQ